MLTLVKIDARGISCPQPVLMTKNALMNNPKEVEVTVDNATAKNNVERYMKQSGYSVSSTNKEDDFILYGEK
ncbi:sulfurtransferase TusA family protein [Clostridium algidicarnis]|uniref:Sulfurtransferase TusA family protein n=1 Tax=Clostridium algidicarnis TaxID=37659 RepID=A0ABS6BZR9_9CLOT|nr:sulfurtransferase TusA family protein [Clostridium algidicarnis]MBB6631151.1 sulfurtransferase TusA family protein [Clostridium algidicarnis]MBB6696197.1 sulfurtransferase TusA family protein [Clostridium algidicarnis]MBU3193405.1 sulfurtransferase TusA family protein [Clostridium algidicarnis]MBU3203183.1 sulfurtransferase TusA family protein [Clostridium algidicarnis]MBU3205523.1 sulfurtransferase TusA family protein [Clostridium algidicarnis]